MLWSCQNLFRKGESKHIFMMWCTILFPNGYENWEREWRITNLFWYCISLSPRMGLQIMNWCSPRKPTGWSKTMSRGLGCWCKMKEWWGVSSLEWSEVIWHSISSSQWGRIMVLESTWPDTLGDLWRISSLDLSNIGAPYPNIGCQCNGHKVYVVRMHGFDVRWDG